MFYPNICLFFIKTDTLRYYGWWIWYEISLYFIFRRINNQLILLRLIISLVVTWKVLFVQLWYFLFWCTYVIGQHSTMWSTCVATQTQTSLQSLFKFEIKNDILVSLYFYNYSSLFNLEYLYCWLIVRVNKNDIYPDQVLGWSDLPGLELVNRLWRSTCAIKWNRKTFRVNSSPYRYTKLLTWTT